MMKLRENGLMLQECGTKPRQKRMQVPFSIGIRINYPTKALYFEFACFLSFIRMKDEFI
jgi:hypothetical protein